LSVKTGVRLISIEELVSEDYTLDVFRWLIPSY